MLPPRFSSLKRVRYEEEEKEKVTKREKKFGQSRAVKAMDKTKTQSAPTSPAKTNAQDAKSKARSLPSSSSTTLTSPLSPNQSPKKKSLPNGEKICVIDKQTFVRDLSAQRKVLLRPQFKCTDIDGKSTEDFRNFPQNPRVITLIHNMEGNLKVSFPNIRMLTVQLQHLS